MRFISHLDVVRAWERAIRRAGVPIVFSEGFSPRPRMHFGPALPTCFASTAEYLDLSLKDPLSPAGLDAMGATLSECLPEGMRVLATAVADERSTALMESVVAAEYVVTLRDDPGDLDSALAGLLDREAIPFEIVRKGRTKTVDLRQGIIEIRRIGPGCDLPDRVDGELVSSASGSPVVWCRVATKPRSLRPTEVLSALGDRYREHIVHRSAQLIAVSGRDRGATDGATDSTTLVEPLALSGPTPAPRPDPALPAETERAAGSHSLSSVWSKP